MVDEFDEAHKDDEVDDFDEVYKVNVAGVRVTLFDQRGTAKIVVEADNVDGVEYANNVAGVGNVNGFTHVKSLMS